MTSSVLMQEPRLESDLAVRVSGRDLNGYEFKQSARVLNISRRGGLLSGIRCLRGPGDIIQIEYRGRKADFRVVWVDSLAGCAGVCCLDDSYIWRMTLPLSKPSSPPRPSEGAHSPSLVSSRDRANPNDIPALHSPKEPAGMRSQSPQRIQRKFPRFRCSGGVAAHAPGHPTKVWGQLRVIGLGGCYVETMSPFKPNTLLELLIGSHGIETRLHGEVRCSHPGLGMGIMFTGLNESRQRELAALVTAACR